MPGEALQESLNKFVSSGVFRNRTALVHDIGMLKSLLHSRPSQSVPEEKKQKQSQPKGKALESACQKEPSICFAAYFTRLASSHRMAARSNSVNEVTPNFSFARAQYA